MKGLLCYSSSISITKEWWWIVSLTSMSKKRGISMHQLNSHLTSPTLFRSWSSLLKPTVPSLLKPWLNIYSLKTFSLRPKTIYGTPTALLRVHLGIATQGPLTLTAILMIEREPELISVLPSSSYSREVKYQVEMDLIMTPHLEWSKNEVSVRLESVFEEEHKSPVTESSPGPNLIGRSGFVQSSNGDSIDIAFAESED